MRPKGVHLVVGLLAGLFGCSAPGPSALNYSVRPFPGGERSFGFELALAKLVEQGYSIIDSDARRGTITSYLEEDSKEDGSIRGRMGLRRRGVRRKFCEIRWVATGTKSEMYCKVLVQVQSTQSQNLFTREQTGQDAPGETAIDRDAATTDDQNTVWQTVDRDRQAERALLEAILAEALPLDDTKAP